MKRSPLVDRAHKALQNPDKQATETLLASVNLTLLELEIITCSELDGIDLETICNTLAYWNGNLKRNGKICSYVNAAKIKRNGMLKIGDYLAAENIRKY